jgi:hypothetical protein
MRALGFVALVACGEPFTLHATVTFVGDGPGVIRADGVALETSLLSRSYGSFDDALAAAPIVLTVDGVPATPVDLQAGSACERCNLGHDFVDETDTWMVSVQNGQLVLQDFMGHCSIDGAPGCTWP